MRFLYNNILWYHILCRYYILSILYVFAFFCAIFDSFSYFFNILIIFLANPFDAKGSIR